MHYGIVGIGPVGALFAAHLQQDGHKVSVLCRNSYKRDYLLNHRLKIIGEMTAIHADEKCLTQGKLDIKKIDPLIYSTSDRKYFRLGKEIAQAYSVGKKIKN